MTFTNQTINFEPMGTDFDKQDNDIYNAPASIQIGCLGIVLIILIGIVQAIVAG